MPCITASCRHPGLPEAHPPYDIWCTADGDFIFLRGVIGGYMLTEYELVSFERSV